MTYLFLYCKDTIKSNTRQIIKRKSYQIRYNLTFVNTKIKDYYFITYFLMLYVLLFIVLLYYTLLYIEKRKREKANKGKKERKRTKKNEKERNRSEEEQEEPGQGMSPTSSPVPLFSLPFPMTARKNSPPPDHRPTSRAAPQAARHPAASPSPVW